MAKLLVVEYRPKRLVGVVAVVLGVVFFILEFSSAMAEAPLAARVIAALIGLGGLAGGVWSLMYGPRLASALRRFSESVRIEENKLVFTRPLTLKPGSLSITYERLGRGFRVYTSFSESNEEPVTRDSLEPGDFHGEAGALAGLSWVIIGGSDVAEWMRLPAYEVRDPEYSVPGGSLIIALLPRIEHEIAVTKTRLAVSRDREVGMAEIRVEGGVIEGVLSYSKPIEGKSRAVKLELRVERRNASYKATIARLEQPGSLEFKWRPGPEEEAYIILTDQATPRPDSIVERLGIGPIIAGKAWDAIKEARLRLVLEIPRARDVVDEAEMIVKPLTGASESAATS